MVENIETIQIALNLPGGYMMDVSRVTCHFLTFPKSKELGSLVGTCNFLVDLLSRSLFKHCKGLKLKVKSQFLSGLTENWFFGVRQDLISDYFSCHTTLYQWYYLDLYLNLICFIMQNYPNTREWNEADWQDSFHRIGPLGQFGLVVAKSVCVSVCLCVPFPCDFSKVLKSKWFWCGMLLFININK